jgi:hypothetical protein
MRINDIITESDTERLLRDLVNNAQRDSALPRPVIDCARAAADSKLAIAKGDPAAVGAIWTHAVIACQQKYNDQMAKRAQASAAKNTDKSSDSGGAGKALAKMGKAASGIKGLEKLPGIKAAVDAAGAGKLTDIIKESRKDGK